MPKKNPFILNSVVIQLIFFCIANSKFYPKFLSKLENTSLARGVMQIQAPPPSFHFSPFSLPHSPTVFSDFVISLLFVSSSPHLCFSLSVFEQGRESGVAAAELTEQKIGLMLLEVCHKAGGSDYLRQIYHIIQGNEVGKHSLSPAIRWLLA